MKNLRTNNATPASESAADAAATQDELNLQRLKEAEVQWLSLDFLKPNKALQPRNVELIPAPERRARKSELKAHTASMAGELIRNGTKELEPILVALDGRKHHVVDGHHRVDAYRQAGRQLIPARILPLQLSEAVHVAKLANLTDRAVALHKAEVIEAAWQFLGRIKQQGKHEVRDLISSRELRRRFKGGVSKSTAATMLKRIATLNPASYSKNECDPGTGHPFWKYARRERANKLEYVNPKAAEAQEVADRLKAIIDEHGRRVFNAGYEIVRNDLADEAEGLDDQELEDEEQDVTE